MNVVFLPAAREEMTEAARYYEAQAPRLGFDFLAEVRKGVDFILRFPRAWPVVEEDVRKHLTNRFPFALLYRLHQDQVIILAVSHLSRRPGYWRDRLKPAG